MRDSGLLISWGEIDLSRQEQALLRLFSEVVAYGDKLLEEGRISGFEPFVLGGSGRRGLGGFMIVRGTPEQITTVSHDDEFLGYVSRARKLVEDVGVQELYLGETLRHMMDRYEDPRSARSYSFS
jgi:hypothetical protein